MHTRSQTYRLVFSGTLCGVLLGLIVLVRWAPEWENAPLDLPLPQTQDRIALMDVVPVTRQSAPPAPAEVSVEALLPPEIREEPEPERIAEAPVSVPGPSTAPSPPAPPAASAPAPRGPTRGPLPVRQVQPSLPQEAARARVQAEVVLGLTVGTDGRVAQARVQQRFLLRDGERSAVDALGYGLEQAARDAAMRYLFRPALDDGAPVPGQYTLTLRFGTP